MTDESSRDEMVMMLVESALDHPAVSREAYVRQVCGTDPDLHEEVMRRLEWEERMGDFLRVPVIERPLVGGEPFEPGELVAGRFRIKRVAGRGGMGVVYDSVDEKLDRRVALKCAKVGFQHRLPPEVRSAREVSHFNVCKVYELHTAMSAAGEIDFVTMEFVEGETLADRIAQGGPLSLDDARKIAVQMCDGLAHAHRQGVVHGDLKCANVMLARDAEGGIRAVLTDFGLAKLRLAGPANPGRSERGGTLGYMAPELLLRSPVSVASDLYALGVIFFFMITGRMPEHAAEGAVSTTREAPASLWNGPAPSDFDLSGLPDAWRAVVGRLLNRQPERRFASAEDVAQAIEMRKTPAWVMASAAALLLALAGGGWWQWSRQSEPAVRLAVMPVVVEGEPVPAAAGMMLDVAERLAGLRRNLILIPPAEVMRNQVQSGEQAKAALGATHVLKTRLRHNGPQIAAAADVVDLGSGQPVKHWEASYAASDIAPLAKAVVASVAGTFHASSPPETVNAAAYPYYVEAAALMKRDSLSADEAIPLFRRAIELDPKSALPYAGLAGAQVQQYARTSNRQWLDDAVQSLTLAKSLNPDAPAVLFSSGWLNRERGAYDQAIQDFSRTVEIEPGNSDAWQELARVYSLAGRTSEAVATYQKAMAAQPDYYVPYMDLGVFYYGRGQYQEAEVQFRKVTALAPGLPTGHSNLGGILIQLMRYPEAEQELREALRLRKTATAMTNLAALYNLQQRPDEALPLMEAAIALGPPSVPVYSNLGYTYRHTNRPAAAQEAYRKGLEMAEAELINNPRRAVSRAYLAFFSAHLGDNARASFEMAQARALAPDDTNLMRLAVLTYETLGQRDKSIETLQRAPAALLGSLNREPDLRRLQDDPRFRDLLSKPPGR